MTVAIDTGRWTRIGETSNSTYYEITARILAAVPLPGSRDDEDTAKENLDFQQTALAKVGGGVVLVFFDNMVSQDKNARRVYQTVPDPAVLRGTALVGGSLMSRAMGSFFLGLSKPRVRLQMFGSAEEAVAWGEEVNREMDGARGGSR